MGSCRDPTVCVHCLWWAAESSSRHRRRNRHWVETGTAACLRPASGVVAKVRFELDCSLFCAHPLCCAGLVAQCGVLFSHSKCETSPNTNSSIPSLKLVGKPSWDAHQPVMYLCWLELSSVNWLSHKGCLCAEQEI